MAATAPTERLAGDVKDLRTSDQKIGDDIRDLMSGLGIVRAELRLMWRIGAGVAILGLPGVIAFAYEAGSLKTTVESNAVQTRERFDLFEKSVNQRFDQFEKRLDKTDAKLDQILQRLDQAVPKKGGQ
jgi:hypothetical protein